MQRSIFLRLKDDDVVEGKITALEREMTMLSLLANPGATLGQVLTDVYDYLKVDPKTRNLEAVAQRLISDEQRRRGKSEEGNAKDDAARSTVTLKKAGGDFGRKLIDWIEGMPTAETLLVATGYNINLARKLYCEEDYLVADTVCAKFLEDRWNQALVALDAAVAPWAGGGKSKGDVEVIDMTMADDDDPQWKSLQAALAGG